MKIRTRMILVVVVFVFVTLAHTSVGAENWPCFRGPSRQGIAQEEGLPTKWSATENVSWKTTIPGAGWSSPIVWEDRIFVTTTTGKGENCHVISLNRKTGRILWNRQVFVQELRAKRKRNSYATPTPITDGKYVYSLFADGTIVALDFDGETVWMNRNVSHYSAHGLAASPVLYKDLLIMNYDGSSEAENLVGFKIPWEKAVILAVDKKTGQEVWRGARGLSRLGHVTSNFLRVHGKDQMVSAAGDVIQGFDPTTGARIWSVYAKGEGVVPSVVVGDGLVYTSSGFEETTLRAVRPDGQGDVTKTHVAWSSTKGVSHIPSFLYRKPYLFMINETGIAVCLEAQTGKILWQSRVGGNHSASPIWSDGLIYFHSDEGETTIIKAAGEYEEVARNDLGELSQASFAVSNGQIFIRTEKNLYCIGD